MPTPTIEPVSSAEYLSPRDFVHSPAALARPWSVPAAESYTRWLATHHYENFHVVTFLLPKSLHQDFHNVYAFCRWADDLGDEIGETAESLRLLAWWRGELDGMYAGRAMHPVYVALEGTARRHSLPRELFADLIRAFVQDQTVTRYQTWPEVFEYCRYSANPVGRLVLRLCGYADDQRDRMSDATCTALQLANFWQDVTVDLKKDRIYLPLSLFEQYGYSEAELAAHKFTPAFRLLMKDAVDVAQALFEEGLPLARTVDRRLAFDLDLFSRGGMQVLRKIRRQGYDVLRRRPHIGKVERISLLLRAMARVPFRGAGERAA